MISSVPKNKAAAGKRLVSSPTLPLIYDKLYQNFGPQHWWPGDTRLEIIVGAILTQNTNWGNVEKAIANLKKARALDLNILHRMPADKLAQLIRPSGYFNVKAKRLKNFVTFLMKEYQGSLSRLSREPLEVLREKILGVNGIGKETADSILLYAFNKPIFVIDAYTKRILTRHFFLKQEEADYDTMQALFTAHIKKDVPLYNEFHALIVMTGKNYCKPKARCEKCPLNGLPHSKG